MHKSTSFSDSRNGKTRPANLLTDRSGPSESLPWPSPSFDVFNNSPSKMNVGLAISADPGRPSTQAKVSQTDLPPTPLTSTYKPLELSPDREQHLRLPSVKAMLAHTPPESRGLRTVPLPETEVHQNHPSGTSPIRPGFHALLGHQEVAHVSSDHFRNMPQSEEVQGLGLDLGGDDTPRLGGQDWASMRTPTLQTNAPRLPGAPQMISASNGQLSNTITSPINPPLRNWNTDLRFEDRPAPPMPRPNLAHRSFSENYESTPMEREYAMQLEGGMPQANKTWGLALSMDNGETYRRGGYLYRPDASIVGPAAMVRSATGPSHAGPSRIPSGPPTPMRPSEMTNVPSSASKVPGSASKHLKTTGLTPHIHKTRLTPTFSSRSKGSNNAGSPNGTTESPSLKMKSKQRSEQLRNQAASVAAQANLPSEHASVMGNTSPTSPTTQDMPPAPIEEDKMVEDHVSPIKHDIQSEPELVGEVKANTASSPWGVFELGTTNNKWQPLGPPALSNVLGKLNLDEAGDDDEEMDDEEEVTKARPTKSVKRARKQGSSTTLSVISTHQQQQTQRSRQTIKGGRPVSRGSSDSGNSEGKENDVFGSSALSGANNSGRRTPIMGSHSANTSPNKSNAQGQRRLLSIR